MKVKAVLIGAGKVGAGFADDPLMANYYPYASHAQVLTSHPRIEWGAVVDVDASVASKVAARWNVPRHGTSVGQVCEAYEPELAVVATPPVDRLRVLDGLPGVRALLVEKPLGATEREARAFLDECDRRGILVEVNLWRRADRALRSIRANLRELVGDVQTAFVLYGSGLHNNGTHMIDLVRMLIGPVVHVRSVPESLRPAHGPIPDDVNVTAILTTASSVVVHLAALDFRHYRENGIDIWGTRGRLAIWQEGLVIMVAPSGPNRAMQGEREVAWDSARPIESTCGTAFLAMYDNVLDAVEGKEPLVSTGASALMTTRVVDLVERSAREDGRTLSVDAAS